THTPPHTHSDREGQTMNAGQLNCTHAHTHTHTHIYKFKCAHTHTYANTHTHTHTHTHAHTVWRCFNVACHQLSPRHMNSRLKSNCNLKSNFKGSKVHSRT